MPDYLVLKKHENLGQPWEITQLVRNATAPTTLEEARAIAQQGYTGEGRYRLVRWDNGRSLDLTAAPPVASEPPEEEPAR